MIVKLDAKQIVPSVFFFLDRNALYILQYIIQLIKIFLRRAVSRFHNLQLLSIETFHIQFYGHLYYNNAYVIEIIYFCFILNTMRQSKVISSQK